jgi:hypothetical protein
VTLDDQIAFLRELAAEATEMANLAVGIATIQQQETERAARLIACANTIAAEARRREECRGDWS